MLWRLFKKFDVDDTDYITKDNLFDAFTRLGKKNIEYREVDEIIKAHDIKNDGRISFAEFKLIFKDDKDVAKVLTKQQSQYQPDFDENENDAKSSKNGKQADKLFELDLDLDLKDDDQEDVVQAPKESLTRI